MIKKFIGLFVLLILLTGCSTKLFTTQNNKQINVKTNNKDIIDINKNDFINELSIHDAVRAKDFKIVKFLINQKSHLNNKDLYGYTPLHLAVRFNQLDIVKLLVNSGATVNSIDNYGDTPLIDSTRNKFSNISEFLICNGANRNVLDDHERTPLSYAASTNDLYISNLLIEKKLSNVCKNMAQLSIDKINHMEKTPPKICGVLTNSTNDEVTVSLEDENKLTYGPYVTKVNKDSQKWCVKITDELKGTSFSVTAKVKLQSKKELIEMEYFSLKLESEELNDEIKNEDTILQDEENTMTSDNSEILDSLYEALYDEFRDDFDAWNAQLDKDTLSFRFKSPHLMFKHGNSKLQDNYMEVLNEFFPRYIKILEDYETYIQNVFVEGHTSSEYKMGKTKQEKFDFNMALSKKRAHKVFEYVVNINSIIITESKIWITEVFKAVGKSSSQLITNEDGSENAALSRRVEFKIKTIPKEM